MPQTPAEPRTGSLTHIVTTYSGCRAGYPVVWAAFDGGHIAAPQDGASQPHRQQRQTNQLHAQRQRLHHRLTDNRRPARRADCDNGRVAPMRNSASGPLPLLTW
ncbi:hypothetical protein [Micromonospora zhanjiangensis]|uniref:Uncharacterized protein n=1 Tax=Micromonospora zhanjiangensis TaxID=1522057 RepID=A0ABV8KTV0_9ACTN